MMAMLAMRESGGRSGVDTVQSGLDPNKTNEYSIGISQINWDAHKSWLPSIGITNENMLRNPTHNARAAKKLYDMRRTSGQGGFEDWKGAAGDIYHNTNDEYRQRALQHLNNKGNESGGYTSRTKVRSVSSTPPPSRGVIVNMVPIAPETGGLGSINVEGSEDVMMVDPSNPDDIIGKLYRTQWNIVDVG